MRPSRLPALLAALCLSGAALAEPIPLAPFNDAIHHWQNAHGTSYARHAPEQYRQIADNLLRLQRADGGWPENRDPARILDAEDIAALDASEARGGSFDNRNIYTQVAYLAEAHARSGDARYRDAATRGLEFVLAQQIRSCGGWPHTVPARQDYHPHITMADEVSSGVLGTLRRIVEGEAAFAFVEGALRERVTLALQRGDACLLRLQVIQGGRRTGWAGQYDRETLLPAQGRSFELPSLVSDESVSVLRYLMSIREPSPAVIAAIEAGTDWLQRSALRGLRYDTVPAPLERFPYHSADFDRRVVPDPAAPPLWARFYDLEDNTPVFATREGRRVARFADVPRERRTGYNWYGRWPAALLESELPAWKARLSKHPGESE